MIEAQTKTERIRYGGGPHNLGKLVIDEKTKYV